jgi:hypothetical protein
VREREIFEAWKRRGERREGEESPGRRGWDELAGIFLVFLFSCTNSR